MLSQEIRRAFLKYFQNKRHALLPSSPVFPHDDPSLLFINAGMNQFKDIFLGERISEYKRAVTSQKCIRVGGKHNDLENVGHTSRHLTFFEMLGNFSFGDYFKKEAIALAWEVTTEIFCFDPVHLWVTVFHEDKESFELWKSYLPENRIVWRGEKDNFWTMGESGPCGPCSELLYDRGESFSAARNPAEDVAEERFLEFWNLVFMEFNRDLSGELSPLPKKCVDTGAGLERIASLKMDVCSLFETDILRALISQVERVAGKTYHPKEKSAAAFRVIADHLRSLAFAIADGVQPSNIERGYVLRKVLRRAVRYGKQLGFIAPFLAKILPTLIEMMGKDFPELAASEERISEILTLEEENFFRTLRRGGDILGQIVEQSEKSGQISGDDAFKLKDTYGLPLEEILLLAKDANVNVDIRRFEELSHLARERSKGARKKMQEKEMDTLGFERYLAKHGPTAFVGYQQLTLESVVLGLMKNNQETSVLREGEEGIVFLDRTPFYAERGGQVGDQGVIAGPQGRFEVLDCQHPFADLIAHIGVVRKGDVCVGDVVHIEVDAIRRQKISNNHTATHLLHWALCEVLGEHIRQGGSIVEPARFRFDFHHHKALTHEEINQIEKLVNAKIRENSIVSSYEIPFSEAQKRGDIKQFFGDKYGTEVRVVDIDYSKELCGGTHTRAVGTIGYFRIVSESSVAAGVRRIEAVTGEEAEVMAHEKEQEVAQIARALKVQPSQLPDRLASLLLENKELEEELSRLRKELLTVEIENLEKTIQTFDSIRLLAQAVSLDPKELRECADLLMERNCSLVLFLVAKQKGESSFLVRISSDLVQKKIRANDLVQQVIHPAGGKGGGRADAAAGGGIQPDKIENIIELVSEWIEKKSF